MHGFKKEGAGNRHLRIATDNIADERHGMSACGWKEVVRDRRGRYARSMTLSDIQARLADILATEEAPLVDWPTVDRLCEELDRQLEVSREDVPEIVAHFLSDSDIRARDTSYGDAQRDAIRTYLATCDYFDGVAVPWWGCLAPMLVVVGVVVWALA